MSEKSHVSMAQHECLACGRMYDTGEILLDKRLRNSLERFTCTGVGVCESCRKEGYCTLIGIDPRKSNLAEHHVFRTGEVLHMKCEAFHEMFPKQKIGTGEQGWTFIDTRMVAKLKEMMPENQGETCNEKA